MGERPSHIGVAGFENLPCGQLLTQFVDFDHPMAAAYERCVGYTKDFHTHDRVNLTFPRNASRIHFTTKEPDAEFLVDDTHLLWMPAYGIHRQETRSALYDNLAIFPATEVVEKAKAQFVEKYKVAGEFPNGTIMKKRTPFLDAMVAEYFSERILEKRPAEQVAGLTYQILEETLKILWLPSPGRPDADLPSPSPELVTVRALRFIENHLFGEIDSRSLARSARTSVPTLFRKFRSDTGMTPREYIVRRRMDEAKTMLRRGEYKVGDIALLIGYEDSASFSKAFKSHTGYSPTEYAG